MILPSRLRHNRIDLATIGIACLVVLGGACEGAATLSTGSTLIVAFEPGFLYASASADGGIPTSCAAGGGAIVRVLGFGSDGTPAKDAQVVLWLGAGSPGSLASVDKPGPPGTSYTVTLGDDGSAQACLLANTGAGTVTVNARSGVVQASGSIDVRARVVPSGGTLNVTVTPLTAANHVPSQGSTCGEPGPGPCVPGDGRLAAVALEATPPSGGPGVPDPASAVLSVDQGWLSPDGGCTSASRPDQLVVPLQAGAATTTWCFGNTGAQGTVTAVSGTVTGSARLAVPAVPATLTVTASQATAVGGANIVLTAFVAGCDGSGVVNEPVQFMVTAGALQFATAPGLLRTGTDGTAIVSATVTTAPVSVTAKLLDAPAVSCPIQIGASQ